MSARMLGLTAWYGALAVIGGCLAALMLQAVETLDPETPTALLWMASSAPIYAPGIAVGAGVVWLRRQGGTVAPGTAMLALAVAAAVVFLTYEFLSR